VAGAPTAFSAALLQMQQLLDLIEAEPWARLMNRNTSTAAAG
jgi:hypothetical protein